MNTYLIKSLFFSGELNLACIFVSFKIGTLVQRHVSQLCIKSIYLNPQKSNTTRPGKMRWERECECEERRIMLIRNQEGRLRIVYVDFTEVRMCLVSRTFPEGE